ncbi:MAG: hypothetical protein FWC57_01170 [Endomicrobia bacterium]|nr:hypothetical protein [Endomicrobiia bacterium]
MYIDFASDWPAYIFMAAFLIALVYVIVRGHSDKDDVAAPAQDIVNKK